MKMLWVRVPSVTPGKRISLILLLWLKAPPQCGGAFSYPRAKEAPPTTFMHLGVLTEKFGGLIYLYIETILVRSDQTRTWLMSLSEEQEAAEVEQ
jgi:hypothetical protein